MDPNFASRTLFYADNLPILRGMNSETVDLIATDPPFNKGRDFHATPDSLAQGARFQDRWSWTDDVQGEWVDAIKDDFPAVWSVIESTRQTYGDDMAAFLCFMGVRLMEMQRILKPTGSLYLHCDSMASHLKAMCDAVFKSNNFQSEIVWRQSPPARPIPRRSDSRQRRRDGGLGHLVRIKIFRIRPAISHPYSFWRDFQYVENGKPGESNPVNPDSDKYARPISTFARLKQADMPTT